jgi:hypothetical protein
MRYRPLTVSIAAILCILSGPASADGYTLFDPGDSIATFPRAVNASGVVAGYYEDGAFVDHGFARASDGTIMPIDPPGSVGTEIQGINDSGWMAGAFARGKGLVGHAFLLAPDGTFEIFDVAGMLGNVAGLDAAGRVAGSYSDVKKVTHGYLRRTQGHIETFDPPGSLDTEVTAISPKGVVIGTYSDAGNAQHAFLRALDGTITVFDPTRSTSTFVTAINASGNTTGSYFDSQWHGFLRTP